ncbi:MAG: hemerythrin domain-containing protein [Gloeobacterales cyanobacterium]
MVSIITSEKRQAIAVKLADIKALQNLVVANEQVLITACEDEEIREWLANMLIADRRSLQVLENVIVQYGHSAEPKQTVQELVSNSTKLMQSHDLALYEKVSQHELLKHRLAMFGIEVHKASQLVGTDIEKAISPLHSVNFENQGHQEQLQGILEILSTRELTGEDPKQGIWERVQDSLAALKGVVVSVTGKSETSPDKKVTDIVHMDHEQVRALFKEIENTDDPQKLVEFFSQLYRDLTIHAQAKEQTWYPALLKYDDSIVTTEQAYREQEQAKSLLIELRGVGTATPQFKEEIQKLKQVFQEHVDHEERDLFAKLREHMSEAQLVELGKEFQLVKKRLQDSFHVTTA